MVRPEVAGGEIVSLLERGFEFHEMMERTELAWAWSMRLASADSATYFWPRSLDDAEGGHLHFEFFDFFLLGVERSSVGVDVVDLVAGGGDHAVVDAYGGGILGIVPAFLDEDGHGGDMECVDQICLTLIVCNVKVGDVNEGRGTRQHSRSVSVDGNKWDLVEWQLTRFDQPDVRCSYG